jgi:tetratricopeptide (TPR) repeat protein
VRSANALPSTLKRAALAAICAATLLLAGCAGTARVRPATQPAAAAAESRTETDAEAGAAASSRSRKARDARLLADRAAADVPEDALRSYERALAAMASQNWIEAELELEQLLLEHGGFAGPYVNLAIVLMQDGREEEARAALDEALALNPAHPAANNQLGILLRQRGEFDAAEAAYRRAIEADPQYAIAYLNLGVLLDLYLRRQMEALEYYELYQDLIAEPDQQVGRWIIDLRRRLGVTGNAGRVARGDGT